MKKSNIGALASDGAALLPPSEVVALVRSEGKDLATALGFPPNPNLNPTNLVPKEGNLPSKMSHKWKKVDSHVNKGSMGPQNQALDGGNRVETEDNQEIILAAENDSGRAYCPDSSNERGHTCRPDSSNEHRLSQDLSKSFHNPLGSNLNKFGKSINGKIRISENMAEFSSKIADLEGSNMAGEGNIPGHACCPDSSNVSGRRVGPDSSQMLDCFGPWVDGLDPGLGASSGTNVDGQQNLGIKILVYSKC
ncbi:hypothetical protein Adt_40709 [Abeliophyllum distichum]|uniref:Uncharacterized protein n=1 Tax=Abeliophyllum distichum TaxID=126358 RepID=A0ABD1PNC7_9LAMI